MTTRKLFLTLYILSISVIGLAGRHRVLFIGDSITDGAWGNAKVWNASSEQRDQLDMNHIYGHGYMMIAASYFQSHYTDDPWTFWNRGISGNTLDDLATRWQQDVMELHPDIVSILVGTNDVEKALNEEVSIDLDAWNRQLCDLLDKTLEHNANTKFILCTPFVAKVGWRGSNENYELRLQLIKAIGNEMAAIADKYDATLIRFDDLVEQTINASAPLPASYWIWDGIHPTPAMHYKMAEMWIEHVLKNNW